MTMAQVAPFVEKNWLGAVADGDLKEISFDGYVLNVSLVLREFGDRRMMTISAEEILEYRREVKRRLSSSSSNRRLFVIKALCREAIKQRAMPMDVSQDISYLSEDEHVRNGFLMPDGVENLLKACEEMGTRFYMRAVILLAAEHGASTQEVLNLCWKDIHFEHDLITLRRTKNGVERTMHLMPRTKEALLRWRDHLAYMRHRKRIKNVVDDKVICRLNGVPLKSFKKAWRSIRRSAGFSGLHYHDLRHTYCTNLGLIGAADSDVQGMVGHLDPASTRRYRHVPTLRQKSLAEQLQAHYAMKSS